MKLHQIAILIPSLSTDDGCVTMHPIAVLILSLSKDGEAPMRSEAEMAAEVDGTLGGFHAGGESGDIHVQQHEGGDRDKPRDRAAAWQYPTGTFPLNYLMCPTRFVQGQFYAA